MAQLPNIYTIQATDAHRNAAKLQEILENLKVENRINNFTNLETDVDLPSMLNTVKDDDLILIMLTDQLETQRDHIETKIREYKEKHPYVRIAEIIVDNQPYDNTFITFPADLRPIRNRDDTNTVWNNIEQSLKELFPPQNNKPFDWKEYTIYGAYVLIGGIIIWGIFKLISGSGPEAQFTYYVGNAEQDTVTACYAPCNVRFTNNSQNFDSSQWQIEDSLFSEKDLRLTFVEPGDKEITLTAFKDNKKSTHTKNLLIKSPPVADFEIINNGCTAPCNIRFTNTSSQAESYSWNFGNGQTSSEFQPEIRYETPDEYEVTLIATNEDGRTSETKKNVTTIQDDSPFADFTFSGTVGSLPRQVTYSNQSQNAGSYVWRFPGGSPSASSNQNPSVTYNRYDTYSVTLIAQKNGRSHQMDKVVSIRKSPYMIDHNVIEHFNNNELLMPVDTTIQINPPVIDH